MEHQLRQKKGIRACQSRLSKRTISGGKAEGVENHLLMGNDSAWAAECVGRAWVGHIADTGIWEGLVPGLSLAGFQQKMLAQ